MVKGSRTSVHDITDRILLELAKKQYRLLRNAWSKNSQTEICYFRWWRGKCLKGIS